MHSWKKFLLVTIPLFSFSLCLAAQDSASIVGSITDATGAVVPGATVLLMNPATGKVYKTVSGADGAYTLSDVPAGPGYKETVTRDGFQTTVLTGLYLNVGTTRSQNVKLAVGSVAETVAVSAANEAVTLDTTDATVGNNFEGQFLSELPIALRDSPIALLTQQPGMTNDGAATGSRTDQNRITVDGLDVNDMAYGTFGTIVANAPVDSIQVLAPAPAASSNSSPRAVQIASMEISTSTTATRIWKPTSGSTTLKACRARRSSATSSAAMSAARSGKTRPSFSLITTAAATRSPARPSARFPRTAS